ncbi:hypothetical protein TSTA_115190 [Talaromyces stipitatus ATCC 10500]|uniref:Uncharacterized protein n=1 Tax=Talaromyces stipitatus (strain ATCC 10500 / CBS 375.48 / QM 6759 / NRRL 1006) TaxID=441959 RepID=B8M9G0_TALSN|nr:uncharacterized protein TSTA_115190 [Talaromyces stipitatus ATCC 10500]EED17720.1 hypothetical protein TSTA_115190 [Talaromyces stipitatus ATCC 10500]
MLSPNALKILDHLGVYASIKGKSYNFDTLHYRDLSGKLLGTQEFGGEGKYRYRGIRIYRYVLIDRLLAACKQNLHSCQPRSSESYFDPPWIFNPINQILENKSTLSHAELDLHANLANENNQISMPNGVRVNIHRLDYFQLPQRDQNNIDLAYITPGFYAKFLAVNEPLKKLSLPSSVNSTYICRAAKMGEHQHTIIPKMVIT